MKKVGILGGTFNPIHLGHLLLAESAKDAFGLDEILFMPSGISYMKEQSCILPASDRVAMTKLAIRGNTDFALSTLEADMPENSYTSQTIQKLQKLHPEEQHFFIIGADSLFHIQEWKQPARIFQRCVLIAAVREELDREACRRKAEELQLQFGADIRMLPDRMIDISSTEIRERITSGRSVRYMLPDSVMEYILEHGLYR